MDNPKKRIALFASGSGTNVANIIDFFQGHPKIEVGAVFSNRKRAGVLDKAQVRGITTYTFNKETFYNSQEVLSWLKNEKIDFIALAGFLMLVPEYLVEAYKGRIINIHPALLPKYGGKGMYGSTVHEEVLKKKENKTGITIHYVNPEYDEGQIIAQIECSIDPENDSLEEVEEKVHELEYDYYPRVIEELVEGLG